MAPGADTVAGRFGEYYRATWHLDPDMPKFLLPLADTQLK
jgi:hypothetical protein